MRYPKCSGARVKEGTREPGQSLGARFVAGGRIAGREHNPVGIELQLRHLGHRQKAVVQVGGFLR